MANFKLENINISSTALLSSPREVHQEIPLTPELMHRVQQFRQTIERIFDGEDPRLLAIVGPCSIHNYPIAKNTTIS